MKRLSLLLYFVLAACMDVAASVPDKKIVVKSSNGSVEYVVADIRSIKFSNGDLLINMNDGSVATWATDNINIMSFLYYEPSPETGIDEKTLSPFSISAGVLRVESVVPAQVSFSTVEGKLLFKGNCNGELQLPVSGYPAGIYILCINGTTYKIINR